MKIGLFVPCYIDAMFPEVGIATLELLERFGHDVHYPRDQTCCGQPMVNSGFNAEARATEALFVRNFSGFDYVVSPSGSYSYGHSTSCLRLSQSRTSRIRPCH